MIMTLLHNNRCVIITAYNNVAEMIIIGSIATANTCSQQPGWLWLYSGKKLQ